MNTFKTIMKYTLIILGIIVWLIILLITFLDPILILSVTPLWILVPGVCIAIKIIKSSKTKKLQEENEQLKKRVEELERQLRIEKIIKESDAKRGH